MPSNNENVITLRPVPALANLYPEATETYIDDLEPVDSFGTSDELAKKVPKATEDMLRSASEAVRKMEECRRQLAYYASVLHKLSSEHPGAVERLSYEDRHLVGTLSDLLRATKEQNPA